jgi:hypothetical protein
MKRYHVQWEACSNGKAERMKMAGSRMRRLGSHAAYPFHFLLTGDESWMFYEYDHETM